MLPVQVGDTTHRHNQVGSILGDVAVHRRVGRSCDTRNIDDCPICSNLIFEGLSIRKITAAKVEQNSSLFEE